MKVLLATIALTVLSTGDARALEMPSGDVVLTVSGAIAETNRGAAAVFDRAMLEALPGRTAVMETPWTTGEIEFSGPYLRAVLAAVGADGRRLIVRALNDYSAEVPISDATGMDTILASRVFGEPMVVRDKGPLMLVYPFDRDRSLYNEKYFSRSVWQIKEIEVVR